MKKLELGMYGLSRLNPYVEGYGVIAKTRALEVLITGWNSGIRFVDTAPGYGNGAADDLIKNVRLDGFKFNVCSKIGLDIYRNQFKKNLQDIYSDVDNIARNHDGYVSRVLIHSPPRELISDQATCSRIILYIRKVLGNQVTVGISLKSPNDLADCMWGITQSSFVFQSNFSWLDTRIRKIALNLGVGIIARSIYGSGILAVLYDVFHNKPARPIFDSTDIRRSWDIQGILRNATPEITEFRQECSRNTSASLDELVASLIQREDFIKGAILGPTTVQELKSTLEAFMFC